MLSVAQLLLNIAVVHSISYVMLLCSHCVFAIFKALHPKSKSTSLWQGYCTTFSIHYLDMVNILFSLPYNDIDEHCHSCYVIIPSGLTTYI
uniref:Uncharacterized protein n=1 Tax=Arundo donax TaxID=35708 RepID=A0A0A9CYJ8_ARUDO